MSKKTTPQIMQSCVDAWTQSISECIRALRNIKSSTKALYLNQVQQDAITQSVLNLKAELDDSTLKTERFTLQSSRLFPVETHQQTQPQAYTAEISTGPGGLPLIPVKASTCSPRRSRD
jgi:hypothetical protein